MIRGRWHAGNRIELLEGGEEYFPRVFAAIRGARAEVLIETFILFEDAVGKALQEVLIEVARRGVRVKLTLDGFGSPDLSRSFISQMTESGVHCHFFDPQPKFFGVRTNILRRLHRKLVVVDGEIAFVGGINFSHDHLLEYGPDAKLDHAAQVKGPVVRDIHLHMTRLLDFSEGPPVRRWLRRRLAPLPTWPMAAEGSAVAMFVTRDNRLHRDDIERHYRRAIARARDEIIIANAYFFPGYRLLGALRKAARRGVSVHLILQGNSDVPVARFAAQTLYGYLVQGGVRIHEHHDRPLHSKVAVVDGEWATIGSSNLDPVSLFLNLEANLVVRDREFAAELRGRLMRLISRNCTEISPDSVRQRSTAGQLLSVAAFEFMRQMPSIARWLPGGPGKAIRPEVD